MVLPQANVHIELEVSADFQNQTKSSAKVGGASIAAAAETLTATITSDNMSTVANKLVRTIEMYIPPAVRSAWGNAAQQKAQISQALLGPIAMASVSSPKVKSIVLS